MLAFVDPNAQADQSGADPNNPMAQIAADKSSHLEPLLAAWGVEFKSDQVVADLERGLAVSHARRRAALAAHRHPRVRRRRAWPRT